MSQYELPTPDLTHAGVNYYTKATLLKEIAAAKKYANNYERRNAEALEAILANEDKEPVVHHEVYSYIGTSDRQRAYLVRHGIPHQRKGGEFR